MASKKIYPYAVAAVRSMENKLIDKQTLLRMADAKTAEEALKILKETDYGKGDMKNTDDFETVISNNLSGVYSSVAALMEAESFIDIFLYKNDYHNLKVLIKAEITKADPDKYLVGGGTIDTGKLKAAFRERSYGEINPLETKAIDEAFDSYGKSRNARYIDFIMDKACFKTMAETAKKTKLDYAQTYVRKLADITNLKTLYRIFKMKLKSDIMEEAFVGGGILDLNFFKSAAESGDVTERISDTEYKSILNAGDTIGAFEKACDDYMITYAKDAKYKTLTPEPIIGYILAKENEAATLRTILSCKERGIDPEVIKERVRETYV